MVGYAETVEALTGLTRSQLELFGTGAAARLAPLVERFGSASARRRYADGLGALWEEPGRLDPQRAKSLSAALDRIPEAGTEDDLGPENDVMRGVLTLAAALRVARGNDVVDPAETMCALPWNFAGEADSILGLVPSARWWKRGSPPPGPFESAEEQAQQESLRLLTEHADAVAEAAEPIRQLSEQRAAELAAVLPEYAQRRGWAG